MLLVCETETEIRTPAHTQLRSLNLGRNDVGGEASSRKNIAILAGTEIRSKQLSVCVTGYQGKVVAVPTIGDTCRLDCPRAQRLAPPNKFLAWPLVRLASQHLINNTVLRTSLT